MLVSFLELDMPGGLILRDLVRRFWRVLTSDTHRGQSTGLTPQEEVSGCVGRTGKLSWGPTTEDSQGGGHASVRPKALPPWASMSPAGQRTLVVLRPEMMTCSRSRASQAAG